jgi:hypothetical protein
MKQLMVDVVDRTYQLLHTLFDDHTGGELLGWLTEHDPVPKWNAPRQLEATSSPTAREDDQPRFKFPRFSMSANIDRHHVIAAPILRVRRASLATTDKLRLNRQLNSASGVALKSGDGGYRFGYGPLTSTTISPNQLPQEHAENRLGSP